MSEDKLYSVVASVSADGYLAFWHAYSGKCIMHLKDPNNSDLYCIDYNQDGSLIAVGGKDCEIKLYDDATKSLTSSLKGTTSTYPGHANRIFSVKFSGEDKNLLISGGWDCTIFLWI